MAAVSVTTSATLIAAANTNRGWIEIVNNDASATLYLGHDNTVTAANGVPLEAGDHRIESFDGDKPRFFFRGTWYGIAATGTIDVRVLEMTDTY